jgi:hypothetical protein
VTLALVLAIISFTAYVIVQYRYAMAGAPSSKRWRWLLFVTGACMGATAMHFLFSLLGITASPVARERQGAIVMTIATAAVGGVASAWFIPQGMQKTLQMARREDKKGT